MKKWRWYHGVLIYAGVQAVSFGLGKLVQTIKEQSKPKIDEQVLGNESYNEFYNNLKQPVFAPPDWSFAPAWTLNVERRALRICKLSIGDIQMVMETKLNIVNEQLQYPKVSLIAPVPTAYIHIAAEVDKRFLFLWNSKKKRNLINHCKKWCEKLKQETDVIEAVVFKALIIPPGRGNFVKKRKDTVHIARFDVVVLIEVELLEAAERIRQHPVWQKMEAAVRKTASYTHVVTAVNVRRINAVDHKRNGVFLFNYFFADDTIQNLDVWEYTAGWFEQETGLDNSTLLLPAEKDESKYNVINHCRWDHLSDILPSLLFKRTFRTYVLDNFEANNVAAMPVLYQLA